MAKNLLLLLASTVLTLAGVEVVIRAGLVKRPDFFESSGWWKEHWLAKRRGPVPHSVRVERVEDERVAPRVVHLHVDPATGGMKRALPIWLASPSISRARKTCPPAAIN